MTAVIAIERLNTSEIHHAFWGGPNLKPAITVSNWDLSKKTMN